MSQAHELELRGCAPEPLMAYLKGLGIFRLVAEQKDPGARACWQNDGFFLSSALDREALAQFFLEEYRPTPIVSPWNGGSGFHARDNARALNAILGVESPRFQSWQEVIATAKLILAQSALPVKEAKEWVLGQCRARFPDAALDWLDAAYVLTAGGATYPPLLGTGGNDGRLDFSNNFMQSVVLALNLDQRRSGDAIIHNQVVAALFDEGSPELVRKRSTGFYNPGSVGGANASVGFNDEAMTNPWDYVLMLEGALLFAGAAARRLSSRSSSKAVFPFTVDNSAAGYGTAVDSEYGGSARAEFWAPLWDRPACLNELNHLVSEGRAQLGRRQVSNGTDFARAAAGLGMERGVAQFQRYGFLERNGRAYLAAPLGRFRVRDDRDIAERANVLFDLEPWLESLRRTATVRNAPAGLGTALRRVDQAIIDFCQHGQPPDLQNVLIAVGHAERWLATSSLRNGPYPVRPLSSLSREWLHHADDETVEFRLARAMASVLPVQEDGQVLAGPIRENLEPVEVRRRVDWKQDSTSFVWTSGDALSNMLAVLERRCLEGKMASLHHPPLEASSFAGLDDVTAFLNGAVDVQRMVELALPLSCVRHRSPPSPGGQRQNLPVALPAAYAVMKLTLLPGRFICPPFDIAEADIWMDPAMIAMLRAGRVQNAYQVALRRLRAAGLPPTLSSTPGISDRSEQGRRLAAALLFPTGAPSYTALATLALRRPVLGVETESPPAGRSD
ncbi:MAG: type I-U CRISPR-associated protein Csx17 [Chloroflexi bacterium]|nr:type I-U CRISPR-associated protein Csx17 [Chloroflexota bacterium]